MTLGRLDEETTSNIVNYGGQATNIVADYAEILAEARSLPDENFKLKQIKLKKTLKKLLKN